MIFTIPPLSSFISSGAETSNSFPLNDFIIDFTHHAFYFGDEVEKAETTGIIPDFDIKKPFTKKKIL